MFRHIIRTALKTNNNRFVSTKITNINKDNKKPIIKKPNDKKEIKKEIKKYDYEYDLESNKKKIPDTYWNDTFYE